MDEGDGSIQSANKLSKSDYGEWWVFFGYHYRVGDYLYKEKMEHSYKSKDGVIDELKVAFSREQHLIEESRETMVID